MGVRLLQGRWFGPEDDAASVKVMIVTRALAHRYFGRQSPIGTQVRLLPGPHPWTIIGVVDDVHNGTPWEESYPQFFMDARQVLQALPSAPERMRETAALGFLSYAVRADQDPTSLGAEVRAALRQLDPAATLDGLMPLDEIASASLSRPRFYAVWSGLFALVAAILGCTGVYATVAYATVRRTREIGIRVALGAQRSAVVGLVLSQGVALATAGVVVGLGAAHLLSSYLTAMLFGATTADALTYVVVGTLFFLVAAGGALLPALAATRINPVRALRYE
jgi:ABC-type antimicrobial peptide transport system permease subunit